MGEKNFDANCFENESPHDRATEKKDSAKIPTVESRKKKANDALNRIRDNRIQVSL